jgi:hypothetical protein
MTQHGETHVDKNGRLRSAKTRHFLKARKSDETPDSGRTGDLAELRGVAMELLRGLRIMMPSKRKKTAKEGATPGSTAEATKTIEPLPPEFDRLLSRNAGVIDGFATLVQLVIRIRDKEQEVREETQSALPSDEFDEDELDRRIEEELDRIAARRRAADELEAVIAQQEE